MRRSYEGPSLDQTVQYLTEAPYWQDDDGETVELLGDEEPGEETFHNVPTPEANPERPDTIGARSASAPRQRDATWMQEHGTPHALVAFVYCRTELLILSLARRGASRIS